MTSPLALLYQAIQHERGQESRREGREQRDFERLGLGESYSAIAEARRQAARQDFERATARLNQQQPYQLVLPGMNTTLMALRARDGRMSPAEQAAAGIAGVGWQRSPAYPTYEQADLLEQMANARAPRSRTGIERELALLQILMAANPVAEEQRVPAPVVITPGPGAGAAGPSVEEVIEEVASTPPPSGMSGRRMAMRYGLPALGALLGLYGLGAVANANARDEREVVRA